MNFLERKKRQKQQILDDIKNQNQMSEYRDNQSKFGFGKYAGKAGSAIKNKFGKQGTGVIANYADDAINGVDNYGAIGNYADDAIKGTSKQATSAVGDAVAKEGAEQLAETGAKSIGKGAGKAVPIIGGVMSAKSAYDRASKGDYIGAGLDVVSGVASFIPGIGTAIALGADALNAMKDIKKNDEMKTIAKSQQAIADNQASALGNLADKKQEIKAQQQDNLADMQLQTQPDMSSVLSNEINSQIDAFAPSPTESAVVEPSNMLAQNTQLPEIVNPTFDTPQPQSVTTPEQDKSGMVANILNSVKGMAGKVDNTVDLTQDKIGGMVDKAVAKVKPGISDFMAGYQDNRNTSFTQGDLYKQLKPQDSGMFAQGNIDLANRPVVKNEDGTISTVKSMSFEPSEGEYAGKQVLIPMVADNGTMMNEEQAIQYFNQNGKHLGVFNDVDSANKYADSLHNQQDVYYNGENASPVLKGGAEEIKKSIMAKLGEMAGTTARGLSNPVIQGLIASGIYKATGGDTGESLQYGVNWAQDKAKSDMYAKLIGQQPGILGGKYDSKDYNAYVMNKYKDGALANQTERNKITKEHYDKQEALERDKLDFNKNKFNTEHSEKVRHNKATESLDAQRIKKDIMKANLSSEESFIKAMSEAKKLASTDAETSNYLVERIEQQRQLDLNLQSMIDRFGEDKAYRIYSDLLAETWN